MNLSFHAFVLAFNKPHYLLTRWDHLVIDFWECLLIIGFLVVLFLVVYAKAEWDYRKQIVARRLKGVVK